jgi:hypothetical protein
VLGIGTLWSWRGCSVGCVVGSFVANAYACAAAKREWAALTCLGDLLIETSTTWPGSDCG